VPQQRKLVIVLDDGTTFESTVVTLSDAAEKELKKPIDNARNKKIATVDLKKA
jgi:hypothetical protein